MKKSTVVAVLAVIFLLAALAYSVNAVLASRAYLDCASRLMNEAPPGDRLPPESFRRLARAFLPKHDLYLVRVLARECAKEQGTTSRRFSRQLVVLGTLKVRLPSHQRETLSSVLFSAYGGRGLTHAAQTEWGRPPEALTDPEMTWLFVVGQLLDCSRARAVSEGDRQACAYNYEILLSKLRSERSLESPGPS